MMSRIAYAGRIALALLVTLLAAHMIDRVTAGLADCRTGLVSECPR